VEFRTIDDSRDDFVHIVRRPNVRRQNAIKVVGTVSRRRAGFEDDGCRLDAIERRDDAAHDAERIIIALCNMVDHAGTATVYI
jgi:hypothetical protein